MPGEETIVAIASAPPPAGRVVIRISGPAVVEAVRAVVKGEVAEGLAAGELALPSLAPWTVKVGVYLFVGPRSYTGEDVAELHLPGSPWIVSEVMGGLLKVPGVRHAEPGEFTARAFLSGKLDLTAAEGVAAVISATDARQLRAARQLLAGDLAASVRDLCERLAQLLALLEAGIDFTDQDVSFISRDDLRGGVAELSGKIARLLAQSSRVRTALSDGGKPTVLLMGRPNAGKSTLVNALLGRTRSVISAEAGTTRDVLYADLELPSGSVRIADTAGLERDVASGGDVLTQIEAQMRQRALTEAARADVLVLVRDATDESSFDPAELLPPDRRPDLRVVSKMDLGSALPMEATAIPTLAVSAHTRQGLPELIAALDRLCFARETGDTFALTARHVYHLTAAADALEDAKHLITAGDELIASSLRAALDELGAITGVVSPDDVLGRVFATFCIGK